MKSWRLLVVWTFVGVMAQSICAGGVPKVLKEKLFARYDQQNLTVVRGRILVTTLDGSGGNRLDYSINYDHFDPLISKESWPKKYLRRNLLDEYTTEEVESSATFTDPMSIGEMVRVRKFYVSQNKSGVTQVDFYMEALDGKRISRYRFTYPDGYQGLTHKIPFGVHFRFYFFPDTEGNEDLYYDQLTEKIDRFLLPTDEYQQHQLAATEVEESKRNVTLQPGMSKEDVVGAYGEPLKTIVFGSKTILSYENITIELEDDKVVDVKVN